MDVEWAFVGALRHDLRSVSFLVLGCLLVLGVDAVAEVIEADGYYWENAVDMLGSVLRDGR